MTEKILTNENELKIVHTCTQGPVLAKQARDIKSQIRATKRNTVLLNRLSKVSLGNGHEEDGLLFIVRKFVREHEAVLSDIKEIKLKLSSVAEIDKEIEIQRRVKAELEKKKVETKEENEIQLKNKTFSWGKIPIIVGVLTVLILLVFQILNYKLNMSTKSDTSAIKEETTITNDVLIPPGTTRGQHYNPFPGDTIK